MNTFALLQYTLPPNACNTPGEKQEHPFLPEQRIPEETTFQQEWNKLQFFPM